jgi:hypothetical protein
MCSWQHHKLRADRRSTRLTLNIDITNIKTQSEHYLPANSASYLAGVHRTAFVDLYRIWSPIASLVLKDSLSVTSMSAKVGHRILDFPEIFKRSFTSDNNCTNIPIPIIFLFKSPISFREEVLQRIKYQSDDLWPTTVAKRDLGIVPWLRNFTPSMHDISVFANECIVVDKQLLDNKKCIVTHLIRVPNAPLDADIYEYATVAIDDAYTLMCSHPGPDSWFPGTLDATCRFQPISESGAALSKDTENESEMESDTEAEGTPDVDLPIFVPTPCTSEQQEKLLELLSCDFMEPELFYIPVTSSSSSGISTIYDDKKIDSGAKEISNKEEQQTATAYQVMQHLLSRSWFPVNFIVVDEITLSSPYFTSSTEKKSTQYPSFLYGARLCMWHIRPDGRIIASDTVGYAVNRVQMKDEDDYGMWCGAMIKGMGLGHWVEEEDAWKRYHWSCWVDETGRLDGEVQAEPSLD